MKGEPILERKGKGEDLDLNLWREYVYGSQKGETKPLKDHTKCSYIFYDDPPKRKRMASWPNAWPTSRRSRKEQPILKGKGKGEDLHLNLQMGYVNGGQRGETKPLRDHKDAGTFLWRPSKEEEEGEFGEGNAYSKEAA